MNDLIAGSLAERKFAMTLMSAFAAAALLLSAIGVYGVASFFVSRRTREIGIRLALGARRRDVLGLVLGQGVRLTVIGLAVGLSIALASARVLSHQLYDVTATDPATFAFAAFAVGLASLCSCYLPARRAASFDPMTSLRHE